MFITTYALFSFPQYLGVLTLQYQPKPTYTGKGITLRLVVPIPAMSLGTSYVVMANGMALMAIAPQVSVQVMTPNTPIPIICKVLYFDMFDN